MILFQIAVIAVLQKIVSCKPKLDKTRILWSFLLLTYHDGAPSIKKNKTRILIRSIFLIQFYVLYTSVALL
jgi:hypothetical protein